MGVVKKKRKQRGLESSDFNILCSKKISIFLISIILTISFPGVHFWLNYVMSSICRKQKSLSSLYAILCMANVVSHMQHHERKLAKKRANEVNVQDRLIRGENIWNLCIIDNIDFREETFAYDNIFGLLLNLYGENFEIQQVHEELWKNLEMGCQVEPPNVVILEPGDNPNNTENIHAAARMYFNDVGIDSVENLEIACDEAIFRRFNTLNETNIRPLLGAWHTSKAMCVTLLTIFSGYGIYDLAAHFGVCYLDKLEKVIDYPATCRVLEYLWIIVGIALNQYTRNNNLTMKEILNSNHNLLKVWYLFFC